MIRLFELMYGKLCQRTVERGMVAITRVSKRRVNRISNDGR